MSNFNQVVLSGHLTRDAELRQTATDTNVLTFGIAVNEKQRNNQTGEWDNYVNFFDCTMFGNYAHAIAQYMTKGRKVGVVGKLRYSQWERDGQKRSKVGVIANNVEFMGGGSNQQKSNAAPAGGKAPAQHPGNQPFQGDNAQPYPSDGYQNYTPSFEEVTPSVYDEDIPF